jgi:acetolactate synthase-1/2/3 large subunit
MDAHRIAAVTGARLLAEQFNTRIERGANRPVIERIPYIVDEALAVMADLKHVILVGAAEPVGFFAYPNKPGRLYPTDAALHVLARPEHDLPDALARLADELEAPAWKAPVAGPRPEALGGAITKEALGRAVAALLPDNAIVIDESITFADPLYRATRHAAPHDWLQLTGGAIGDGLPLAAGAALGAPGRRVIGLQADGSAMYTVQALWTQARERLDVTTVILSNRKYSILLAELAAVGAEPGQTAMRMLDLSDPDLDWVRIAGGLGVEAAKTDTLERFADLFTRANSRSGPFVIEAAVEAR